MSVFKKNTQPPKGQPSSQRRRLAAAADARFPTVALIAARSWTSVGESEEGGGGGYGWKEGAPKGVAEEGWRGWDGRKGARVGMGEEKDGSEEGRRKGREGAM